MDFSEFIKIAAILILFVTCVNNYFTAKRYKDIGIILEKKLNLSEVMYKELEEKYNKLDKEYTEFIQSVLNEKLSRINDNADNLLEKINKEKTI